MDLAIEHIYTEWAYRSKTGLPSLNNPEDKKILDEIYKEYGIPLMEGYAGVSKISEKNLNTLIKTFKSIKDDFSKYLSIFSYFSPESLHSISDVLLAKLIEKESREVIHAGSTKDILKLTIGGQPLDIRTATSDEKVEIAGDTVSVSESSLIRVKETVEALYEKNPELREISTGKLVHHIPNSKFSIIDGEIKNLARKLIGKEGREAFVWLEKVEENKQLKAIEIHIIRYSYEDLLKQLLSCRIMTTDKGWELIRSSDNIILVQPDFFGKHMNISAQLIEDATEDTPILIKIKEGQEDEMRVKERISDRFLKSLDRLYTDIFETGE